MIYKNTWLIPNNKIDVTFIKTIHLYNKLKSRGSKISFFIKIVAKNFFFKTIWRKKLKKVAFLLATKYKFFFNDLTYFKFFINSSLILKKRLTPLSFFTIGSIFFKIKRKKLHLSFNYIL